MCVKFLTKLIPLLFAYFKVRSPRYCIGVKSQFFIILNCI